MTKPFYFFFFFLMGKLSHQRNEVQFLIDKKIKQKILYHDPPKLKY